MGVAQRAEVLGLKKLSKEILRCTGQFRPTRRVFVVQSFLSQQGAGALDASRQSRSAQIIVLAPMDFDSFYRTELAPMVALARGICGDLAVAEEVAQEAFTKAHQHWSKVAKYERPGAWLRRVTINLAISKRRRLGRELVALRRKALERPDEERHAPDHDDELWHAVRQLPPRQRAVVALFYQEDRSTRDIAEILDCSISTATSHLNQARKKLAVLLGEPEQPAIDQHANAEANRVGEVER